MLITNPDLRATLAEVLSHPWMILGFTGPPDPRILYREPLRADELDHQVIRGMTGFEFGSKQDIKKKMAVILESADYIRAVEHWERKRSIGGHLNGHGKEDSRWGDLSNSSHSLSSDGNKSSTDGHLSPHVKEVEDLFSPPLDGISLSLAFDSSTSSRGDPPTPSKKSQRFSKLFSRSRRPVRPESHLSHSSVNEPNREPLDPTSGYHPLLSVYYLVREKLERERVYGLGHFASSRLSIQDLSGASSSEGPGEGRSCSITGVNFHINPLSAKREKELPAGSTAEYNPCLVAPTSYDDVNANNSEELRRNEEEARRKEQEAKWKEQKLRWKEQEAEWMEQEVRRKEQEVKWKEQDVRRRDQEAKEKEELRKKDEKVRKRETEVRKHEEEVKKREDGVERREEELRECEAEVRKRAKEAQQKELETKQKKEALDVDMVCAPLFMLLQVPETCKKLADLQEEQAQEMMDLLQKVSLASHPFISHTYMIICASF